MAITPLDIKKKTFATQLRGYSKSEVRAFLAQIAAELEELCKDRGTLAESIDEMKARVEAYERTEKLLQDTLVTAQKATGELREDARREAEVIIEKARVEAEKVRLEVANRTTALREELRELQSRRANLVDEIEGTARTYLAMAERHRKGLPAG
jgi:cell division initiation protein